MESCKFIKSWIGPCGSKTNNPNGQCDEHQAKCCSCGALAVMDCEETMGPFVCGCPLCADCEHTTQSNGCNSGGLLPDGLRGHCKKTEQVYKPWYTFDDLGRQQDEDARSKNGGKP